MPPLNNFSNFFPQKKQFLVLLKEITQLDFQKNLEKENTVRVNVEKL